MGAVLMRIYINVFPMISGLAALSLMQTTQHMHHMTVASNYLGPSSGAGPLCQIISAVCLCDGRIKVMPTNSQVTSILH